MTVGMLVEYLQRFNQDAQIKGRFDVPLLKLSNVAGVAVEGNEVDHEKCSEVSIIAVLGPTEFS